MKKLISAIAVPAFLVFGNPTAWGYMISDGNAGGNNGAEVGGLDTLIAEQAGPFTGGSGNPSGEEA